MGHSKGSSSGASREGHESSRESHESSLGGKAMTSRENEQSAARTKLSMEASAGGAQTSGTSEHSKPAAEAKMKDAGKTEPCSQETAAKASASGEHEKTTTNKSQTEAKNSEHPAAGKDKSPIHSEPVHSEQSKPKSSIHSEPVHSEQSKPKSSIHSEPVHSEQSKPKSSMHCKPVHQEQTKPKQAIDCKPVHQEQTKPKSPMHCEPVQPEQTKPKSPMHCEPVQPEQTKPKPSTHSEPVHSEQTLKPSIKLQPVEKPVAKALTHVESPPASQEKPAPVNGAEHVLPQPQHVEKAPQSSLAPQVAETHISSRLPDAAPPPEPLVPANDSSYALPTDQFEVLAAPPVVIPTDVFTGQGPKPAPDAFEREYRDLYSGAHATTDHEHLIIPALGLDVDVDPVGLGRDVGNKKHWSEMVTPQDPSHVGRWAYPAGNEIIAGHVSFNGTPGPLAKLKDLGIHNGVPDQAILVSENGKITTYEFSGSNLVKNPKDQNVWKEVFGAQPLTPSGGLELITCAGPIRQGLHQWRQIDFLTKVGEWGAH